MFQSAPPDGGALHVSGGDRDASTLTRIRLVREMAIEALPRMVRSDEGLFGWCIRRHPDGDILEGTSFRYTAIVLLGMAVQEEDLAPRVYERTGLPGSPSTRAPCGRLLERVEKIDDVGDVALALWAAVAAKHPDARLALERLRSFQLAMRSCSTVALSWALSSLCYDPGFLTDGALVRAIAKRLMKAFRPRTGLFPHDLPESSTPWWRRHVCCFADWVYPVQALSHYHRTFDGREASEAGAMARLSAERMCRLQGEEGQWWWHYDVRAGRVVERYPVYAVHQDAMAPMALLDLRDACGADHSGSWIRGLNWLFDGPECGDRLVDRRAGLIWRKVARREPGKLVRGLQAAAGRLHPRLRVPGVNRLFPPGVIDYECRPYHLGWILYAFSDRRPREWTS